MVAAGTGLTPMLSVHDELRSATHTWLKIMNAVLRNAADTTKLVLIYINKSVPVRYNVHIK